MTNVEALKNLYVSLGGSAADVANVTTIADMITALQDVASGGGGTVVCRVTTLSSGYVADKTGAELNEAISAGKIVLIVTDGACMFATREERGAGIGTIIGDSTYIWGSFTGYVQAYVLNFRLSFEEGEEDHIEVTRDTINLAKYTG